MTPSLLANALLSDGRRVDIRVADARIADIAPSDHNRRWRDRIDLAGALILPGLIDGHIHLDKTLLGMPFTPHRPGDNVAERIRLEKELRRGYVPVEERAMRLVEQVVAYGTVALRTHVDIDDEAGLDGLHALLRARGGRAI